MEYRENNYIKFGTWNRKIINAFWVVALIYVIGQVLVLALDLANNSSYSIPRYIKLYMLKPDSIIFAVLICTELSFKYLRRVERYLIIITSITISYTAFFNINREISGRQIVLLIPILLSIFYFSKRVLMTTCFTDLLIIWIAYLAFPTQRQAISSFEMVIVTLGILSAGIIGIGVVGRGIQLLNLITTMTKNEEKLIIEKSIIDKLSKTDALTGLYNHRTFHEYVDTILEQQSMYNFQVQLALIDIDNFKKVNDTYGHWSGDIVLKEVGSILHGSVTADDFVSRYGGEEFAIIFIGRNLTDALFMLEEMRQAIENRPFVELDDKPVTVSIGVHNYLSGEGKEMLFKYADGGLYKAKASGKNKVICNP